MVTLRRARLEDLPSLAEGVAGLKLFRRYGFDDAEVLRKSWERGIQQGDGLWVAEQSGSPVGMAWFVPEGTFGMGAYLRTLAVIDGCQGQGVGTQLLQTFEEQTADAPGGWFLLVSDFNTAAQRFYGRFGYREVGRVPGLVIPEIAEVILWKPRSER